MNQTIAIHANGNATGNTTSASVINEAFLAQFKADTGWNYSDAVEMAVECRTEDRLFGKRHSRRRARTETPEQKFKRETGWNFGDAVDMASEVQRENRLFGRRHLN